MNFGPQPNRTGGTFANARSESNADPRRPSDSAFPAYNRGSGASIDVAISDSMLAARPASDAPPADFSSELSRLKASLETDPRSRYMVVRHKMDHGPFTALELLQQVASRTFLGEDELRDEVSGVVKPLSSWQPFAPFVEHAAARQLTIEEGHHVARIERQEKTAGTVKNLVAGIVLLAIVGSGATWYFTTHTARRDDVDVAQDPGAFDVKIGGSIRGKKRAVAAGPGGAGGGAPSGLSYEAALARNVQEVNIGATSGGADLSDGQLGGPLRNAHFVSACGTSSDTRVTVKVAVKLGRAVGVTVATHPSNPSVAGCIDRAVRGLSWPSSPKLDTMTTAY